MAGRLHRAGLVPGDRVVWSTPSSVPALAAHVGALRAGLVVVPCNPAYSRRELSHIVADVRPAAAVVGRADQARWIREAATGPVVTVGTDVDLPDGEPDVLDGRLSGVFSPPALMAGLYASAAGAQMNTARPSNGKATR